MAENLHDAIRKGTAHDGLDGLLERLTSYAKFHFPVEESMMRRTDFPACAEHQREHERFAARIFSIKKLTRNASADAPKTLMDFLSSWLEQHTCGEDRRVVQHFLSAVGPEHLRGQVYPSIEKV